MVETAISSSIKKKELKGRKLYIPPMAYEGAKYDPESTLIGVVGEIFCRLNNFSNEDIIKVIESLDADGIADISPFTCMNSIASEAVTRHVSRDHENLPIRTFYFDDTQSD